jgi:hypothetical protein
MAQDAQSEFDRIFGKTQRESENKPPASNPSSGVTRKLPSDSDLLGIRTDSDRFIAKNPIPETLPADAPQKPAVDPEAKTTAQDAMTIALNVNVFANIADAKKPGEAGGDKTQISGTVSQLIGKKSGEVSASAEGATFVIPLPKDLGRAGEASKPAASAKSSIADEFTRILNPKNIPPGPAPNTEFTRVLHMEDSVKVPKPASPAASEDVPPASTISMTSDPKLPENLPPEPAVVTRPGPSDFTKVVKGSELRVLQEKLAATAGNQQGAWPSSVPGPVVPPGSTHLWQSVPSAPVPQYIPAPGNQWPGSPQSPAMVSQASQPSKLSQYMPLIIVLNLLVLMAILLIFFFALKK